MTKERDAVTAHAATVKRMESLEDLNVALNRQLIDAQERLKKARATIDSQDQMIFNWRIEETKKKLIASEIAVGAVKAHLDRALASKAILEEADKDYRTEINRLNGLVSQASPKWKMHLAAELEQTKEKLLASGDCVKMLSKDLDRVIAARAALKALNADNKLLLDHQKRLIEKQDKLIDELKNLSGYFHQDISNYKAAIKNYRDDIDRLWKKNENHRKEIDRLTKLLSEPRPDWRDHTIKTQEIRLKELSDLIGELRRGLAKQKARNNNSDCGTCSGIIEEDLKECHKTIHRLQRESDTMYREKENLLTGLSSKDRKIKKLEAILGGAAVRFGFVYNEE